MTSYEREVYVTRWSRAINCIGGAAGLLSLPEAVQDVLKMTDDLVTKTKMLEMIADTLKR